MSLLSKEIEFYFDRLWPIFRSLTGDGNRETLKILSELVDIKVKEIPSGTKCFDWNVPPEWNFKEAWLKNSKGEKIIDVTKNNLHLLGYSEPFNGNLSFDELKPHLYTLPDQPNLIPYITSYYKRRWGFCLSQNAYDLLDKNDTYSVHIDTSLNPEGSMTVGEALIKGQTDEEILLSTYICHPSMASNELSGPLISSFIYKALKTKPLKYTYRFLFIPETIGSIYSLSVLGDHWLKKLKAGFVLTCLGDNSSFTYKKSRQGNSLTDQITENVLKTTNRNYKSIDFFPYVSDERQYCSPGFNLPVGSLMRSMYHTYPEYHTSADNKSFIDFNAMSDAIQTYLYIIESIELNHTYINTMPYCEPQLGKRGLYPSLSLQKDNYKIVEAMMWVLNLSDGNHDLLSISNKSGIPIMELANLTPKLLENGMLIKK